MKKVWKALSIFALCFILASCSQGEAKESAKTETDSGKIEVEFWYPFTGKIQEANEKSVEEFNKSQDKIHVTAVGQVDYADIEQKVRQSVPAGTAPDVYINVINSVVGLGLDGITQPLTPFIEADKEFDMNDFYEGIVSSTNYNGEQWGLPYFNSTCLLYYNKTLFEEYGIDPASLDTWAGMEAAAKTFSEKGKTGILTNESMWIYESFIYSAKNSPFSEKLDKVNFDTPEGKKTISFISDLIREGYWDFPVPYNAANAETMKQKFFSQEGGMFFGSTANLSNFLEGAKENGWELGAAMMPMDQEHAATVGGSNIVMVNGMDDETAQAAWEFIKFMTSPENNAFGSEHTGYLPIRKSVAESEERKALEEKEPLYSVARKQLEFTKPAPTVPAYQEVFKIYNEMLESLVSDPSITVDEAIETATQRANEAIASKPLK
ncbi:ABC transporter substrate-binding protein [Peptoniphilus sp. KCTC 25270]|uniref:ABC transporter substrate-binding protein n=1 Tax=Peptoniphilus sp. KCTC 25270 TaxID=2897414 RepID=UPI001E2A5A91|nr:ABC transporter substrate-binding protein [Peptoniphilus sp. KCTC 25270]MCD1147882.1 ABC transporter substrate-binding protein [Peptoniphilus sp. KCTC 25270]